jgi:preprotein translocase subunit YajC
MTDVPSMFSQIAGFLTPILLVSVIFILFIFRPQQKKINAHKKFLENLAEGDEVTTYGGVIGTLKKIEKDFVILEIENSQAVRILKQYISEKYNKS